MEVRNIMKLAPIVIFVYNRVEHTKRLLESLVKADLSSDCEVIVFSDGWKTEETREAVISVRECLENYREAFLNFEIRIRNENYGLSRSIISGVSEVFEQYDRIIVLEDDLEVSSDFIIYMNDGLEFYEKDLRYGMISSYTSDHKFLDTYDRDIYCLERGDCWGWSTWKDRWETVDWDLNNFEAYLNDLDRRKAFSLLQYGLENQLIDQHNGTIDAWAARWIFHLFNQHMLTIYPRISRSINCGLDGSGTNCTAEGMSEHISKLNQTNDKCKFEKISVNYTLQRLQYDFGMEKVGIIKRYLNILKYKGSAIKKKVYITLGGGN